MSRPRIAYFVNQYPKVSHSFIRREIQALEQLGFEILRIALRGWDTDLVDPGDLNERRQTRYVLQAGILPLITATIKTLVFTPIQFTHGLRLAIKMGLRADRSLPFHLIYLAEACCILPWLKTFDAKHVHAHFGTNSAEIVMLAYVLGGPAYSFTVHGPEEFDKPQFLGMREKVRRSAFVVAISSYGRGQLYRWIYRDDWSKVKVVHCGLEAGFHNIAHPPIPGTRRLICVGRLCADKGQLLLVEAVHRLSVRGIVIELVLAGDGDIRNELETLIQVYRLSGQVRITGWISSSQVRNELLASGGLILPSFAEGLPVVIMEAMALRRPVLTTYIAGIPELIRPGIDGWLFPAGSIDALMTAIEDFTTKSDVDLATMGDAAYQRVVERHSIHTEAAKLASHFNNSTVCK